jgi:hypothetical protein
MPQAGFAPAPAKPALQRIPWTAGKPGVVAGQAGEHAPYRIGLSVVPLKSSFGRSSFVALVSHAPLATFGYRRHRNYLPVPGVEQSEGTHMFNRKTLVLSAVGSMFLMALTANAQEALPGTINCSEGQLTLDGQALAADDAGVKVLNPGQTLQTGQGRAEVLLTPGVYVRLGENSTLKMESLSATDVKVELMRGEAVVEVDQVDKNRRLELIDTGADAHLDRSGVYRFSASDPAIAVYDGKVRVEDDRRGIELSRGEELPLSGAALKPRKFDRAGTDAVYAWSEKRADYASQVSEWTGEELLGLDGRPSYAEGWYWSPWFKSWAFIPMKGFVLTPFGYGLYAPQAPHFLTPVFGDFRN